MYRWEVILKSKVCTVFRAKVLGGWLVKISSSMNESITFVSDSSHDWSVRNETT